MDLNDPEVQAVALLQALVDVPFTQCTPLSRSFLALPANASLYAVRHRELGLLYVGKTRYTRERFRGGHKAFLWAWLDYYNPDDVRFRFCPSVRFSCKRYHQVWKRF